MKNNKGFSLVELIIVIIIVSVLSLIVSSTFRGYKNKAKMAEGKALMDAIINAEEIYYAANNDYFSTDWTSNAKNDTETKTDKKYNINTRNNKYFKSFKVTRNSDSKATIQTKDTQNKITMQVILSATSSPVFSVLAGA